MGRLSDADREAAREAGSSAPPISHDQASLIADLLEDAVEMRQRLLAVVDSLEWAILAAEERGDHDEARLLHASLDNACPPPTWVGRVLFDAPVKEKEGVRAWWVEPLGGGPDQRWVFNGTDYFWQQ